MNGVNEVLKGNPVHSLKDFKNIVRSIAFLVCEKLWIRGDQKKGKGTILEEENRKEYESFEEGCK